jgi:hypothetical protein
MTRADRLAQVLVASGAATAEEIESGQWSEGTCPYEIRTTADGGRRIQIDKGDVLLRASGATLEEALTKLEAKVAAE